MVHIRQKNYKISISVAVVLSVAFEKNVGLFFIFLGVLDTQEVQWYTKIMYGSSVAPLPKTKPKYLFRYIVHCKLLGNLKKGLEKHTKSTFFTYSQVFIKPGSKLNNSYYSKASYLV